MKRLIALSVLSIIISVTIFLVWSLVQFNRSFQYDPEPVDRHLTYYSKSTKYKLLQRLGYKTRLKYFPFNKNRYNCISIDYEIWPEIIDDYRPWLKEGKRLLVFYSGKYNWNEEDLTDSDEISEEKSENLNDWEEDDITDNPDQTKSEENESTDDAKEIVSYHSQAQNLGQTDEQFDFVLPEGDSLFLGDVSELWTWTGNEVTSTMITDLTGDVKPLYTYNDTVLIAREEYNGGEIIYISDIYLFSDRSIIKGDNGQLLNNLFKDFYNQQVVFDLLDIPDMPRGKEDKPLPWWMIGNIKWLMLHLLVVACIFFLTFIKRFGTPLDKEKFERRSLLRHLEAVGYYFEKMDNPEILSDRFDQLFLYELKKAVKIKADATGDLIAEVKKRYSVAPDDFDIFVMNSSIGIVDRQIKRLQFLKNLRKGLL